MELFTDITAHGYEIIHELGKNPAGGRATYLAKTTQGENVVIKLFRFAKGATWEDFKTFEREVQTLKQLSHPGIPRYLNDFETVDGYCLVQEYKQAQMLSMLRSLSWDEIKHIVIGLLEILVYLQNRIPPVIHRDIKPENVLLDEHLNPYLIDFGFARIGGGSIALSSVNAGTFGFMAPEQIRNLKLTNASDLYSLGLTIICAIARIASNDIGSYIDWNNQLDLNKIHTKLKHCSENLIIWLQKMVAPSPAERFADAKSALEAFRVMQMQRLATVSLKPETLEFRAHRWGQVISKSITLTNTVPGTSLTGQWEVAPHRNDPPHTPDHHVWISITPRFVESDFSTHLVTVSTHWLTPESCGERQLILRFNDGLQKAVLPLHVSTGKDPESSNLPVWVHFVENFLIFCEGLVTASLGLLTYYYYYIYAGSIDYKDLHWAIVVAILPFVWIPIVAGCVTEVLAARTWQPKNSSAIFPWKRGTGLLAIMIGQLGCLLLLSQLSLLNNTYKYTSLMRNFESSTLIVFLVTSAVGFAITLTPLALTPRIRLLEITTYKQQKEFLIAFAFRMILAAIIPYGIILANILFCRRGICSLLLNARVNSNIFLSILIFLIILACADPTIISNRKLIARYRKQKKFLVQP